MSSRDVNDLTDTLKEKYFLFEKKMKEAQIPFIVTCTAREHIKHIMLFCQGRMALDDVNKIRASLHEPNIISEVENRKVTWTLNSKHITKPLFGIMKARAFDIAILKDGRLSWDIKVNVNQNEIPDYIEAGKIGKSVGLKWGGDFSTPDYPHLEE